ncbi:soluble scavenger receptor cysteine-rich domain-containing protein SSC5D-like [Anneissia japonica]|uniref:soluble scavenger receptor cysteine-rich domain-containing protein SSC5D-like n=1 Tax=Anneissia japonica TaxID=1529436 RepID=UPI00142597D6|nr:soluble scavenger receptor cysteine-rich domain-containing protein SSC5D-like [Anneissia japonica]
MFGREARLPVDLRFGVSVDGVGNVDHLKYVKDLKDQLTRAYKLASEEAAKSARKNKVRHDLKVSVNDLHPGDRVLVRNLGLQGKHKLADHWDSIVHIVTERISEDMPVYRVKPESKGGRSRTLHRNILLPIDYLNTDTPQVTQTKQKVIRPNTRAKAKVVPFLDKDEESPYESSDEEITVLLPIPDIPIPELPKVPETTPEFPLDPGAPEYVPRVTPILSPSAGPENGSIDMCSDDMSLCQSIDSMAQSARDENVSEASEIVADVEPAVVDSPISSVVSSSEPSVPLLDSPVICPDPILTPLPDPTVAPQLAEQLVPASGIPIDTPNDTLTETPPDEPVVTVDSNENELGFEQPANSSIIDKAEPMQPFEPVSVIDATGDTPSMSSSPEVNYVRRSTRVSQPPERLRFESQGKPVFSRQVRTGVFTKLKRHVFGC